MYTQIEIYKDNPNKAIVAWKETTWHLWKQEQPDAEILEQIEGLLIINVPGYEANDGNYEHPKVQLWGISEIHIYNDSTIYWEPDLYIEAKTIEDLKQSKYYEEFRNNLISQELEYYNLSKPIGDPQCKKQSD